MTTTSRQSIQTLITDLSEVLATIADQEAALAANDAIVAGLDAAITEKNATIAAKDAEIAGLNTGTNLQAATIADQADRIVRLQADNQYLDQLTDAQNQQIAASDARIDELLDEIERLKAELALYRPRFILGDGTRQQFLDGFDEPFPFCYQPAFYRSGQPASGQIDYDFVVNNTLPDWRAAYPNSPRWSADIEWQWSDNVFTAAEVQQILPAFQAARDFFAHEGRGVKLGGYGFIHRFGIGRDPAAIKAQIEVYRPILDLLDEAHLALYPIYESLEASERYIRENIAMAREAMPGKPVYCILWPAWHGNVKGTNPALPGTPISVEWWRMALDTCYELADGVVIWMKAAAPKPTNEPWWLETQAWRAA